MRRARTPGLPVDARWIDLDGVEHAWPTGNTLLTAHIEGIAAGTREAIVPVRPSTWGAIKGHYR